MCHGLESLEAHYVIISSSNLEGLYRALEVMRRYVQTRLKISSIGLKGNALTKKCDVGRYVTKLRICVPVCATRCTSSDTNNINYLVVLR